ncbi:MAG: substrate-binding domain-containing protein [Spirochaetia bacterium]|jgi:ABC-type sugar transport system substrate-binding protein
MKKLGFLVFIVCAVALAFSATSAAAQAKGQIKIGMVNLALTSPYFIGMSQAVKQEADHFTNIKVITTDAKGDAQKLTSDVEDVLAQNVSGLIVSAAWLEAAPEALDAIKRAGVPVVLVDRKLKGGDYTSWVGPDNLTIGKQDGQYIVKRLGGKGRLVVLRGGPADNSIGLDRTNGMLSEVKKSKIDVVMAPNFGGWSSDGGFKLMEDLLAKYNQIDAVFAENDSMALGAQKAIADAGRTKQIFIAGVDGEKAALEQIMNKTNYACTGLNSSDQIGRAGFTRLMSLLAGAQAERDTVLPSPLITIDNVARFYIPESVF